MRRVRRLNRVSLPAQVLRKMARPGETFTRASLLAGLHASGARGSCRWVDELLRDAVRRGVVRRDRGVYRMLNPNLTAADVRWHDRITAPYAFGYNLMKMGVGGELERTPKGVIYVRRPRGGRRVARITFARIGALGVPDVKISAVGFPRRTLALLGVPSSIVTQEYKRAIPYVQQLLGIATAIRRNPKRKRRYRRA